MFGGACRIDQDIHRPNRRFDPLDSSHHSGGISHVDALGVRGKAAACELSGRRRQALGATGHEGHTCPLLSEGPRTGQADAPTSARHHDHFACEL